MPNIKPISDLRNYTAVVNEVSYGNRVYLTRNGHGSCAIIDMQELDELDKQKALNQLLLKLQEAEKSVIAEGTISADELEKELGHNIFVEHNYFFYRLTANETILILEMFHEKEDFMRKLFGIVTTSQETIDYWKE